MTITKHVFQISQKVKHMMKCNIPIIQVCRKVKSVYFDKYAGHKLYFSIYYIRHDTYVASFQYIRHLVCPS